MRPDENQLARLVDTERWVAWVRLGGVACAGRSSSSLLRPSGRTRSGCRRTSAGRCRPCEAIASASGQVLSNLIENAVGPGIPAEHQRLIFEKFGRAKVTKGQARDGLGLFIARSIAEAHGGSLDVRSTPRRGATFTLSLPVG